MRKLIGVEEYEFWRDHIELFLSGDRIGGMVAGAHRQDAVRVYQRVPKLTLHLVKGHRFLNVALFAEATAVEDVGRVADPKLGSGVKYDRLNQAQARGWVVRDRRSGNRVVVSGVLRFFSGLGNGAVRWIRSRVTTKLWPRLWTGWLLRAMRASDASRVVKVESQYWLRVDWGRDGKLTTQAPIRKSLTRCGPRMCVPKAGSRPAIGCVLRARRRRCRGGRSCGCGSRSWWGIRRGRFRASGGGRWVLSMVSGSVR